MSSAGIEYPGISIILMISVLWMMAVIPHFLTILAPVLDCIARWKGSVHLHASVSLSRSRNYVALSLILPFIMICSFLSLWEGSAGMHPMKALGLYAAIFAAIIIVRFLFSLLKGSDTENEAWQCGKSIERNFFIVLAVILIVTTLIQSIADVNPGTIRNTAMWEIASVYFVFLLRKAQFLLYRFGIFGGFLYLCTLEFFPLGLIVAMVIYFL